MIAALALGLSACADPPPPRPRTEGELLAAIEEDSLDPWPHFRLAQILEARHEYPQAITQYGLAINKLPPRSATHPVLCLGLLHHRLGNLEPAARCYGEVLETVASDGRFYASNHDYKAAAMSLAAIWAQTESKAKAREALRKRFLEEFRGTQQVWDRGPTWLKPLTPPPNDERAPEAPEGVPEGSDAPADSPPEDGARATDGEPESSD